MKRSFAYLLIALVLCLMLAGCSDRMDGGMVTSSPAAVSATPVIPSMDVNLTPEPDHTSGREQTGTGTDNGMGTGTGSSTGTGSDSSAASGVSGK